MNSRPIDSNGTYTADILEGDWWKRSKFPSIPPQSYLMDGPSYFDTRPLWEVLIDSQNEVFELRTELATLKEKAFYKSWRGRLYGIRSVIKQRVAEWLSAIADSVAR